MPESSSRAMPPITVAKRRTSPSSDLLPIQVQSLISFLEHEPQPMIVLDTQYDILAANTAYRRQFGAVDRPYLGRKCYQVSHHYDVPCDQAGEHCPLRSALESKAPDRVLHIHHTPRGPEHVDVELRPILDDKQEVIAYVERLTTLRAASAQPSTEGLVGRSQAFNDALADLQRVAPSMLPVLLLGESGSGKELFARAIHEASDRAAGPFVVVDCSGFTETLFESELFGYEKGAFTGAQFRKPGLVETAKGGTLFLDEVGDIPMPMQVKLLRLIESQTFRRVGSVEMQTADFRLVAATHKPLQSMVEGGLFRQDLFYRINAFPIRLPALRQRPDDVELLATSFLARPDGKGRRFTIEPTAMRHLTVYRWPGNVRELRNVLERARLFADDGVIKSSHLPRDIVGDTDALAGSVTNPLPSLGDGVSDEEFAKMAKDFKGTRKELASHLGWSERSLYRRLRARGEIASTQATSAE